MPPVEQLAPKPRLLSLNVGRPRLTVYKKQSINTGIFKLPVVGPVSLRALNLDLRVDANNALNHVTFTAWNTSIPSPLFGLPTSANAMRSIQTTVRLRF